MLTLKQVIDMNKMVCKVCAYNGFTITRTFTDRLHTVGKPSNRRVRKYKNYSTLISPEKKTAIIEQIQFCLNGMGIADEVESVQIKKGKVNGGGRKFRNTIDVVSIVTK